MKTCNDILIQLPDFIRGMIPDDDHRAISAHLASCRNCHKDAELLDVLLGDLKNHVMAAPSAAYWSSLLPRIHERLDQQHERTLPAWITRFAMPVAAAAVTLIFLIEFIPDDSETNGQNAHAAFQQIPSDELQEYAEQQSVVGAEESSTLSGDNTTSLIDPALLKIFLQDDSHLLAAVISDQESVLDVISDADDEEIVPLLEKNDQSSTN